MYTDLDHIGQVGHMYTDYTHHTKHKPYRSQRSYVNSTVLHQTDRIDHTYMHYTLQLKKIIPYQKQRYTYLHEQTLIELNKLVICKQTIVLKCI